MTTPDFPDWQAPAAHAAAIAAAGVPLLGNSAVLLNNNVLSIAGGAGYTSANFPIGQVSYEIFTNLTVPAATPVPFARVRLVWTDSALNVAMHTDTFIVPCAQSPAGFMVRGRGPAKADIVGVSITNLDGANTITGQVTLVQSSRVYTADHWNFDNGVDNGVTVPGQTLPALPFDESVLGIINGVAVAAGTGINRMFGINDGQVSISLAVSGPALSTIQLGARPLPPSEYSASNILLADLGPPPTLEMGWPRAPVLVTVTNTSTTAATVWVAAVRVP